MLRQITILLLALTFAGFVWADEDVDFIELASVLVQDGHYDRAEESLQTVDLQNEDTDLGKYHSIYGLIHLNRGENAAAKESFQSAIDSGYVDETTGKTPEVIYIYLAQINFALEEYREAIRSLDLAGETAKRLSSTFTMRAHAHWLLGEQDQAWTVLTNASERFPENTNFDRRKVFYLVELKLYQAASKLGQSYLARAEGKVEDYLAIGNALRQSGSYTEALKFLEVAHLRYPSNKKVSQVLAHTHLGAGNTLAAAEIFYQASLVYPDLTSEAAELFRRAGKPYRALQLNSQIEDQEKKVKQRLALLLELQRFEEISAMEPAMRRTGAIENEDLRYALAYAYFQTGDFDQAEKHLTKLTRPDLFRKATELRQAMEDCAEEQWRCG